MSDYTSNIKLADAAAMIQRAAEDTNHDGGVLITTHAKPDGDAFGAVAALCAALKPCATRVTGLLMPPVPDGLMQVHAAELVTVWRDGRTLPTPALVIVLDTGAWSQLSPLRPQLERWTDRMLIIDHHLNGDVPAAHRYIDEQAAACCEIVAELIDAMGRPIDPTIAEALFIGLAADTGWFRFSNTRPQTHELAARLLRAGVNHAELYRRLEQTERPQKLALMIRALNSLELLDNGRVALMTLRADDFAQTRTQLAETERFVDIPQIVADVQTVVLVTEPPREPGRKDEAAIRLSFRSKPGPQAINVAELAKQFGGGGHARAAGAKVKAPFEQVVEQVRQLFSNHDAGSRQAMSQRCG